MPRSKGKRSRYTPPPPKKAPPSPTWVPVTMFSLMGLGMIVIVGNYLRGDNASNAFLFVGLGFITAGFLLATQWR